MFTGIIEELGKIHKIEQLSTGKRFYLDLGRLNEENLKTGESIALNGACHTIEKFENNLAVFFSAKETLSKTNLNFYKTGDYLNLELCLTPSSRMNGHFVSGHVDCMAKLLSLKKEGESYLLHFEIPENITQYVVDKGSVCLNGISLTVVKIDKDSVVFSVMIIPHTFENTNLKFLKAGDLVNFEADMLAKYVLKSFVKFN